MSDLKNLLKQARSCVVCEAHLSHGPNPVVVADRDAKILIIGQAPGLKVHNSGIPWDDASGDRLRAWLGMSKERFYGPEVAIMPMGFCYPGKGKSGDLPPRTECAPLWHEKFLAQMPNIKLTVLVGLYAQSQYLDKPEATLTQTVKNYRAYLPRFLPIPHPSPRNNIWLAKNEWFEQEVVPLLRSYL